MTEWLNNIQSQLSADQMPAWGEIETIQKQVSKHLDLVLVNQPVSQRQEVLDLVALVLERDELKTPVLLESVTQVLLQLTVVDQKLLDLVVLLNQETRSNLDTQDRITSFFSMAIRSASSYQQLKLLVNTVIHLASTNRRTDEPLQFPIQKIVFERLVPRLLEPEHALEVSNLLQWLRYHATDSGRRILYNQLAQLIHKTELNSSTLHIIFDFAFTSLGKTNQNKEATVNHDQSQEISFQKVCIERIIELLAESSSATSGFGLLVSFWPLITKELRATLVQSLPVSIDFSQDWSNILEKYKIDSDDYVRIFHMVLEMISCSGSRFISDAEKIQLSFVKLALKLAPGQNKLRNVLRESTFFQQLRPKSIWLVSVWLLLRPLAELIPQSKTGQIVSSLGLPAATFPSQSTFLFVFEYLLSGQETSEGINTANQSTQMKRALLNAMAQLLDSRTEETDQVYQSLQEYLQGYLKGVGYAERKSWRSLAERVWLFDTSRPTADVDRIRNPEVSRQLQQQARLM